MIDFEVRELAVPDEELAGAQAVSGGQVVGWLVWNKASGTIDHVEVLEQFRRQGIATSLYKSAQAHCPHLRHDGEEITADGLAWAESVKGAWNTPHGKVVIPSRSARTSRPRQRSLP